MFFSRPHGSRKSTSAEADDEVSAGGRESGRRSHLDARTRTTKAASQNGPARLAVDDVRPSHVKRDSFMRSRKTSSPNSRTRGCRDGESSRSRSRRRSLPTLKMCDATDGPSVSPPAGRCGGRVGRDLLPQGGDARQPPPTDPYRPAKSGTRRSPATGHADGLGRRRPLSRRARRAARDSETKAG